MKRSIILKRRIERIKRKSLKMDDVVFAKPIDSFNNAVEYQKRKLVDEIKNKLEKIDYLNISEKIPIVSVDVEINKYPPFVVKAVLDKLIESGYSAYISGKSLSINIDFGLVKGKYV